MMKNHREQTLEETLENGREFSTEEIKTRNEKTMRLFKLFMVLVVALIITLVILGIVFGN